MSSPNARGSMRKRGRGGDGHLFWAVLLVGVGLNSSGDPGMGSSCCELVLQKVVRLLVGLSWGGGGGERKARGVAERRTRGGEMLPTITGGWRASALRGEEQGASAK